MTHLQLSFSVPGSEAEQLEQGLWALGALAVTLEDAADEPILEPPPGATPLWPSVRLKALFDADREPRELEEALRALLPDHPGACCEWLADRAWEREWLKDFHAMRFGERLWVCPGGDIPERARGACIVELDPGLAFGTGTHATTALCLEWLDDIELSGKFVIDYGCGSGILAIAAVKLGARAALAVDIDAQALIATSDNAARNHVADRIEVGGVAAAAGRRADILIANILAEPLDELAPDFSALVLPGGRIALSGVLEHQAARLAVRYRPWFDMDAPVAVGGWVRVAGVRRHDAAR